MSLLSKVDTYRALDASCRLEFRVAILWLFTASLCLRWFGLQRTRRWLLSSPRTVAAKLGHTDLIDRYVAWMDIAARNLPWRTRCLERSLALAALLRRRGIPAELRLGVRGAGASMEAHAWVEVLGGAINDDPEISNRFAAFGSGAASLVR
jgi:hypothetical protein